MPGKRSGPLSQQEDRSRREERADRILDAAAELIQRWGYKKTTIDDIARQAGVAKGTIYLHWKTREALFQALLTREYLTLVEQFRQHLLSAPESVTLHELAKQAILLSMSNPLVKALMLGDTDMLGELARREYADPTSVTQRRLEFARVYLELLRSKGIVRTDRSIHTQIQMLVAIATGFLVADQFLPDEYKLSPEESAELLAETVHRTLEPGEPISPEQLQEVRVLFIQYFDHLIDTVKEQIQKEVEA